MNIMIKPVSGLCNMRCKYCFYADVVSHREGGNSGVMSTDMLETVVKRGIQAAETEIRYGGMGICTFAFQGGEPTLAGLDFFRKLIEFQKKHNKNHIPIENAIQTNGLVLSESEEMVKFFAKNRFLVGLSLDGTRNIHDRNRLDASGEGTFDRVIRAAELLKKHRCEFNILCVINKYNALHGKEIYEEFVGRDMRFLQFIPALDEFGREGKTEFTLTAQDYGQFLCDTFELYYRDFKNKEPVSIRTFDNYIMMLLGRGAECCGMNGQCSCGNIIEADGSVYPCDFYVLDEYRLGSIEENSLDEMCNSRTARNFIRSSVYVDEQCQKCGFRSLCRGGCRRDREPFGGRKPRLNRLCDGYKRFFSENYSKLLELAKEVRR